MLLFDAHLDLAMNAIEWNRDLSRPVDEIRAREAHMTIGPTGAGHVSVRRDAARRHRRAASPHRSRVT